MKGMCGFGSHCSFVLLDLGRLMCRGIMQNQITQRMAK